MFGLKHEDVPLGNICNTCNNVTYRCIFWGQS